MRKLLIASGIYPPDIGGPATYSSLLVKEFPKRGFVVKVLTYGPAGISRKIPKGLRHLIYFFVCLFKAINSDIIFAQNQLSAGLPSILVAKIIGRKFIMRVPGDSVWEWAVQKCGIKDNIDDFQDKKYGFRIEIRRKIQRFVANRADAIIVPSFYFKKIVSKWIKNPDKVHVIYNGIELDKSENYNIDQNKDKIILSIGRMVPWKGFDVLVELMFNLPDWKLVIIGEGPIKSKLKELIEKIKLSKNVKLISSLPRKELLEYLTKAKIFILNTSFESFSFQVIEAMNAGLPVITTNICNLPEIIDDGREGILIEPNNKKQIIEAIEKLDKDDNLRKNIIINARKKAQKFSLENTMDDLQKLLESLL
ncbi:MAG TPA: glycosyltransferase family 4 protein [Candidatus Paceibacterota bacterium]|nr:glycosyltransferase family 4 protein [Candidatus Paceibacterota bacterium]